MGSLTKALEQKENAALRPEVEAAKEDLLRGHTKRLNCDVPASLYKKLHLMAVNQDTSISTLVNEWIIDLISKNSVQPPNNQEPSE